MIHQYLDCQATPTPPFSKPQCTQSEHGEAVILCNSCALFCCQPCAIYNHKVHEWIEAGKWNDFLNQQFKTPLEKAKA